MNATGQTPIIWPLLAKLGPIGMQRRPRYTAGRLIPMVPVLPWDDGDRPPTIGFGRVEGDPFVRRTMPVNLGLEAIGLHSQRQQDAKVLQRQNAMGSLTHPPVIRYLPRNATAPFYQIGGITRDSNGAPLGGCTVELYRTDTDERLLTTVSDANGVYLFTNARPGITHYVVAYKAGSPDVMGVTVNTLTGA